MRQIKSWVKRYLNAIKWFIKFRKILRVVKGLRKDYYVYIGTPEHGNLGDHAIAIATCKLLNDLDADMDILEISNLMLRTQKQVRKFAKVIKDRTILLHGGGYLGSLWISEEQMARDIILSYPENRIIILPQTMYFEKSEFGEHVKRESIKVYDNHPNLWLCMREEQSYLLAKEIFQHVHILLIPDMVPYMTYEKNEKEKKGVLLCLRADRERVLGDKDWEYLEVILNSYGNLSEICYTDTVVNYNIEKEQRDKEVYDKIEEFSRSKLVITDRLHGMVFAAIAGTPCIALGNCNYKVKGVYEWIKNNEYISFVESMDQIEEQISRIMQMQNYRYDNQPILEKYEELMNLISAV